MTRSPLAGAARRAAWLVLLLAPISAVCQQPASQQQVTFSFERPGLAVPKFSITVDGTGTARYEADEATVAARTDAEPGTLPTQHLARTVTLSRPTTEKIFATALALNHFNFACASKAKNIAYTGTKALRYAGAGSDGSCAYNYSEDKRVVLLTDLFLGVARTLDVGRKLEFQHRFDRLGLDATMASLVEEIDGGRAMEIGIIAPALRSLVEDSAVLQRVRQRASQLLQLAQSPA